MANFLTRVRNALVPNVRAPVAAMNASSIVGYNSGFGGGWWPIIREPFTGAWQRNLEVRNERVIMNVTLFRCVSLISSDIAKMRMKLVNQTSPNVWEEAQNPAWSPVINNPNHYQNRIQFYENWVLSRLNHGNMYALKERDARNVVVALYILDPRRVKPLVTNNGDVYYQLYTDNLSGITAEQVIVPASEIIHDRWNCLFHPLCGLSPIVANGLIATMGLEIQEHSTRFFKNAANPGGFLEAPGKIDQPVADRLKADFQEKFTGANAGMIVVLGDGLKYNPGAVTPLDSQLIDQLKWSSEMVAGSYGVPAYKVGVGPIPTAPDLSDLEQLYYQSCLQIHIEAIELCLDEGLGLPANWGVEFDLDTLLRMNPAGMMKYLSDGVGSAIFEPNEARGKLGCAPRPGGNALYLQQQNYSLEALQKRDQSPDPFAFGKGTPQAVPPTPPAPAPKPDSNSPTPPDQTTNSFLAAVSGVERKLNKYAK